MGEFNKIKYNNAYNKANYDRIELLFPKGYKNALKDHITKTRESVNGFVKRAIDSQILADMGSDNVQ